MGFNFVSLIIFSLFKKSFFGRRFYIKRFNKIKNRYGVKLLIGTARFRNINKICIPYILIIRHSYLFVLDDVSISLNLARAIKRFSFNDLVDIEINSLKFGSIKRKIVSNNSDTNREKPNPFNAFLRILRMTRIRQFRIFSFKIHRLCNGENKDLQLSISMRNNLFAFSIVRKDQELEVNAIVANIGGKLKIQLASLFVNNVEIPADQFDISTDLHLINDGFDLTIDGFLDMKNIDVIGTEWFGRYFSTISMNIVVRVNIDKMEIKSGSYIEFDHIKIPVIGGVFRNSWPIFGIVSIVELEESIIKEIASNLGTKIYADYNGMKMTINLVVRVNLRNIVEPDLRISLKSNRDLSEKLICDFNFLNYSFSHIGADYLNAKKKIQFDLTESAGFLPLTDLDTKLQKLILLAEDPNFYSHHGVDTRLLGVSLIHNIKNQKFSRGASTITMQVVKNLLLTIEKTSVRKIEQIAIALLIENVFNVTKHRILELYVNLIEFGPNVYGIVSGSRFYFSKHPNDLNITEFFVLLYVIPRPIHFYEALLTGSGQLKRNLRDYLNNSFTRAIQKGLLTNNDLSHFEYSIKFNERFGTLELTD